MVNECFQGNVLEELLTLLKLEAIEAHWQLLSSKWEPETAETLHHLVHSLAGSGGSFGFGQLGTLAREIEIELKGLLKGQQAPDQQQQQGLKEKVTHLTKSLPLHTQQPPIHSPNIRVFKR